MNKKFYIFCHGFGFTAKFWQLLLPYFENEEYICLDLGYFGEEKISLPKLEYNKFEYIGIGHSFGFKKLMESKIKFKSIIGLNGFRNFLGKDKNLYKRRTLEYKFFKKEFANDSVTTLKNFYIKSGLLGLLKNFESLNIDRLFKDLNILTSEVIIKKNCSILIINSLDDTIVPSDLVYDNFLNFPEIEIYTMDNGSHGLGFYNSASVYQKIKDFV